MKTYINKINGISYKISVEEILYSQAETLFHAIKAIPYERIKDGFKIEIGFSIFILVKNFDDEYTIVVPDYTTNPFIDTTRDLTISLGIQFEQIDILKLYNVIGKSVRYDDKLAVAKNALNKEYICLQRFSDLGESGWCINEITLDKNGKFLSKTADEYESYYAYQLLKIRPALIKFLLLPYDYIVIVKNDDILDILNEKDESIIEDKL